MNKRVCKTIVFNYDDYNFFIIIDGNDVDIYVEISIGLNWVFGITYDKRTDDELIELVINNYDNGNFKW